MCMVEKNKNSPRSIVANFSCKPKPIFDDGLDQVLGRYLLQGKVEGYTYTAWPAPNLNVG